MIASLTKLGLPPLIFALSFAGCGRQSATNPSPTPSTNNGVTTLQYWRPETYNDPWPDILTRFNETHDTIKIRYKSFPEDVYEQKVIEAIANGAGPDIWSIGNDELEEQWKKLQPAPSQVITPTAVQLNFAPEVGKDAIREKQLYGLPMTMEPLQLIINQTLLEQQSNVPTMPINWSGLIKLAKSLTKVENGKMTQSGLAIGSGEEILHGPDILSLLMLQKKTPMVTSDHSQSSFQLFQQTGSQISYPGRDALQFYTDFANPKSDHYTWDPSLGPAVTAFGQGKVVMLIDYQDGLLSFFGKVKPNFSITTAPVPQFWTIDYPDLKNSQPNIEPPIDYARYRLEVVSKSSKHPNTAWLALTQLATAGTIPSSDKLSPLKIESEWFTNRLGNQFAASWFKGPNPSQTDTTFRQMIDDVVKRGQSVEQAIDTAANNETRLLQSTAS